MRTPYVGFWLAIVTVALLFVASEVVLSPKLLEGKKLSEVIAHARDDHGYIAYQVENNKPADLKQIIFLGGSGMREGLIAPRLLEKLITKKTGDHYSVLNLSSFDQTLAESLRIADSATLNDNTILVISINPRRFSHGKESVTSEIWNPRIPLLKRDALLDLQSDFPADLAPAIWWNRVAARAYLEGRLRKKAKSDFEKLATLQCSWSCLCDLAHDKFFVAPSRYLRFAYPNRPLSEAKKDAIAARIPSERIPNFERNADFAEIVAENLISLAQHRGAKVVLLDLPRDPKSVAAYSPIHPAYASLVDRLRKRGAIYVDLASDQQFGTSDFFDLDHALPPVRWRISELVVESILSSQIEKES